MNHQSLYRRLRAAALAVVLGTTSLAASAAAPPKDRMLRLAIMPFDNANKAGNDADLQALSNGIPESMIQGLKNISTIRIIERENMKNVLKEQAFAQTGMVDPKTAPKIGALVGANTLMVGSFEVLGDQLRINARFIRADTGEVLGDKSFTVTGRWKEGAFQAMDDLAQKFVASFNVQTTDAEKKGLTEAISATKSYDAYTHYLKGREFFLHFNHAGFNRSIAEYQQALAIDPRYALAEAGLAYTYYYMGFLEEEVGNEYLSYYKQAEEHGRKAIDLAPDSLLGHVALARVYLDLDRIDEGRREVETAVKLNPNDPNVRFAEFVLHVRDRLKNGGELPSLTPQALAQRLGPELAEMQSIKEDNPKDGILYMFSGYVYSQLGMSKETQADLSRSIQLNPSLGTVAHLALVKLYESQATAAGGAVHSKQALAYVDKAVKEAQAYQALDQGFTNPVVDLMKGARLLLGGKTGQALTAFQTVLKQNPKNKDALFLAMLAFVKNKNRQGLLDSAKRLTEVLKEEVDSGQHASANQLGQLLMEIGAYDQAIPYLQTFYAYMPNAETKALIEKAQHGPPPRQAAPQQPMPGQPRQGDISVQQFTAQFLNLARTNNLMGINQLCLKHPLAARNTFHAFLQAASQGGPQTMNFISGAKLIATVFYQNGDPSLANEYNALFPGM